MIIRPSHHIDGAAVEDDWGTCGVVYHPETDQSRAWVIQGAVRSDVGRKRRNNEDAFGFFPELALYMVADGMGGHAAGQVASSLAVETVRRSLTETADEDLTPVSDAAGNYSVGGRRLMIALHNANESVLGQSRNNAKMRGMGTTVAAVLFDLGCDSVAICHVGDSRVYRIRDGQIEQLTEDHTVVQRLLKEGRMQPDEVRSSQHRHVLTQAVGSTEVLHPDLRLERPHAGDVFVLCSDGVHDVVKPEEMLDVVHENGTQFEAACGRLIELANERGGKDNSTVLIVTCSAAEQGSDEDPTLST